jgi:hypothetical protein
MNPEKPTIFVQIASYRDRELMPTIHDMLEKAAYPDNLTIGICWQHDGNEILDDIINNGQFRIIDVDWKTSQGVGWARNKVQELYNGEAYTMQLDSHHRFVKNWDVEMVGMIRQLQEQGFRKPLLTAYVGVYDPDDPVIYKDSRAFEMEPLEFSTEGILLFAPIPIENYQMLTQPIPARFVSGHFYFTLGIHCQECKYDPNIYFHGEEIMLSVRSYTLGYDLFHPHKNLLWHNYIRSRQIKHWDDHVHEKNFQIAWHDRDLISKTIVMQLLQGQITGYVYGFGDVRTLEDYEKFAGVNFKEKTYQKIHPERVKMDIRLSSGIDHDDIDDLD